MSKPAAVALSSCLDAPIGTCIIPMQLCRFTLVLGSLLFLCDLAVALVAIVLPDFFIGEMNKTLLGQRMMADASGDFVLFRKLIEQTLVIGCMLSWFHRLRHYQIRLPWQREVQQVILVATVVMVVHELLRWMMRAVPPDFLLAAYWGGALALILIGRQAVRAFLRRHRLGGLPIVVVGSGDRVADAADLLRDRLPLDYEIVGSVDPIVLSSLSEREYRQDLHRRGGGTSAVVVLDEQTTTVAVTERLLRQGLLTGVIVATAQSDCLGEPPAWDEPWSDPASFQPAFPLDARFTMLVPRSRVNDPVSRALKRSIDVIGASVAILLAVTVFAPFLLWIAWAIKADGGPLLFRQRRVGYHGHLFECLKLRTMAVDAEHRLRHELLRDPEKAKEWNQDFKLRYDPRITRIGHFLRRTSIDELPQIFNVLRGEMSLVGARPIVPAEIERYGEDAAYYLRSRPGLTGLWQVSGRNNVDYPTRVQLDASYVRNWTFGYDVSILLRTFPALLSGRGAY